MHNIISTPTTLPNQVSLRYVNGIGAIAVVSRNQETLAMYPARMSETSELPSLSEVRADSKWHVV